jgi:hypothetical protein
VLQHRVAEATSELGPLMRQIHENEIRRQTQPQPGDEKWDVNAGGSQ